MLESLQDLFLQKEKAETVSFEKKLSDEAIFKKPKSFRRLSKKDISAPCNFKHVSGKGVCLPVCVSGGMPFWCTKNLTSEQVYHIGW